MFITHILYLPVVSCTSGTYWFDGEEVGKLKESQRTKVRKGQIGFVFQSFNLKQLSGYAQRVINLLDGQVVPEVRL